MSEVILINAVLISYFYSRPAVQVTDGGDESNANTFNKRPVGSPLNNQGSHNSH